jgi:excisionase family DNA binding protein
VENHLRPTTALGPHARLRRTHTTKSRRYSTTRTALKTARRHWRRSHHYTRPAQHHTTNHTDDDTTLIVGTLTFAGIGYRTTGDQWLALTAAAQAREQRRIAKEEGGIAAWSAKVIQNREVAEVGTKVMLLDGARFDFADPISMKDLPRSEIYTVAQVARMLSISVGTVYQLLREGAIPAKRLGRRWLFLVNGFMFGLTR